MELLDKKMAPQVLEHPGTRPTETEETVDERILAQRAQHSRLAQEHKDSDEKSSCFYCLEGWVFLGSIGHDGEEIVEAIRCRRCKGTARLNR